jgi:hypothetical protein
MIDGDVGAMPRVIRMLRAWCAWALLSGAVTAAPAAAERAPGAQVPLPRPAFAGLVTVGLATETAPFSVPEPDSAAPERSPRPIARDAWLRPALRWDDHPQGDAWTEASLAALRRTSAHLARTVPADIADWCPGYAEGEPGQRRAFWAGLVSALAWHESTHRARAVGAGRWFGLMQIAPATARARGCAAQTGDDLLDGRANVACAVRIIGQNVARDGVVAAGRGGVAAEWAPFRSRANSSSMREWVRAQDYCQPLAPSGLRPLRRPETGSRTG